MNVLGWLVVVALGLSGAIHVMIMPEHLDHSLAHGAFFGIIGLAQLLWTALNFWKRNYQRGVTLWVGGILSGGVLIVWALAHYIAPPFSNHIHPLDDTAKITKLAEAVAFAILLIGALRAQPPHPKRVIVKWLGVVIVSGVGVWGVAMILTPYLPFLSEGAHAFGVKPAVTVLDTSAYFTIVNASSDEDKLVKVTNDEIDEISLHETTIDVDQVARMRHLNDVTLPPHVRTDFTPAGKHVMLEGLPREIFEGDLITLTFHFESGRTVPIEFVALMMPPETRVNFTVAENFQISNAWLRATSTIGGIVTVSEGDYEWQLPQGFPLPRVPETNPMTEEKVELGRFLCYDERLSGRGTMSCSSCHLQELAFSDGLTQPVGVTGDVHPRNSMSLTNTAYNATFNWAHPTLTTIERQIPIPMFGEHPVELGITGNEDAVLARFAQETMYREMFAAAFPDQDDPITFNNIVLALSSFNRTLISGNSPYDQYLRGNRDAISESAKRGMDMFFSETLECHHCHTGFNMTLSTVTANSTFDEAPFFNTGMYNIGGTGAYPSDNTGVYEISNNPADMGRFRPPTLRNISLTAPYMHDGSIKTLYEVLEFYGAGGRVITEGALSGDGRAHPNKSGFVSGFNISEEEKQDIIAFLESLTDQDFITDPRFSNPFLSEADAN